MIRSDSTIFTLISRDIKVNNKLDFRDIKTSCQQVSSNNYLDFLFSELFNVFISLLIGHITKNNIDIIATLFKDLMKLFCKHLRVNEDNCLCESTNSINSLDKIRLAFRWASVFKLCHMIEFELFSFQVNLLGILDDSTNSLFNSISIGCWEKDVLNFSPFTLELFV